MEQQKYEEKLDNIESSETYIKSEYLSKKIMNLANNDLDEYSKYHIEDNEWNDIKYSSWQDINWEETIIFQISNNNKHLDVEIKLDGTMTVEDWNSEKLNIYNENREKYLDAIENKINKIWEHITKEIKEAKNRSKKYESAEKEYEEQKVEDLINNI